MSASSEQALWVLRAQCGDREALELLLRHIQPSLLRYLRGLVGAADADDVLQEVLLLIFRKLAWLQDPELFPAWSFRIASRAGFRHLAKQRGREERLEALGDTFEAPPLEPPLASEKWLELLATSSLPPGCGAVLTLHFQEELSLAEVAAVLELPLGTVKSRLAYGLAKLRKRLGERRNE